MHATSSYLKSPRPIQDDSRPILCIIKHGLTQPEGSAMVRCVKPRLREGGGINDQSEELRWKRSSAMLP